MKVVEEGKRRGRPRGRTAQGIETKRRLYRTAIARIGERGYEGTTLRDIASEAGVSPGLLYRYFPSKRAVVLELYDELSRKFVERVRPLPAGGWQRRFLFALETSLSVLGPHRDTLRGLTSVLIGDPEDGLFSPNTAFSRLRVQEVFVDVVTGARGGHGPATDEAFGRLLYIAQLAVILWWLLDRSSEQRSTRSLLRLLASAARLSAIALELQPVRRLARSLAALVQEGLFGEAG